MQKSGPKYTVFFVKIREIQKFRKIILRNFIIFQDFFENFGKHFEISKILKVM